MPRPSLRPFSLPAAILLAATALPSSPSHAGGTGGTVPVSGTTAEVYCADFENDGLYDADNCRTFYVDSSREPPPYLLEEVTFRMFRRESLDLVDNCPHDFNPLQIDENLDGVGDICTYAKVRVGEEHGCALREDGTVTCWGRNDYGQATAPVFKFKDIAVGRHHSCGLLDSGDVAYRGRAHCWGDNSLQQLSAPNDLFVHLESNGDVTCGITKDDVAGRNEAKCWGPCGSHEDISDDCRAPLTEVDYAKVAPAFNVTANGAATPQFGYCAIDEQGHALCRGGFPPAIPPQVSFTDLDGGDQAACGIADDGHLHCWTRFSDNPLDPNDPLLHPPFGYFTQVSVGHDHACALTTAQGVSCWGSNAHGKSVAPSGHFLSVSVGREHACAVKENGAMVCWGEDHNGQLTAHGSLVSSISADGFAACAIQWQDYKLSCSSLSRPTFFTPPDPFTWVKVFDGGACGRTYTGDLKCWEGDSSEVKVLNEFDRVAVQRISDATQTDGETEFLCGTEESGHGIVCRGDIELVLAPVLYFAGGAEILTQVRPFADDLQFSRVGVMGTESVCGITNDGRFLCTRFNGSTVVEPEPAYDFEELDCNQERCCALGVSGWRRFCVDADLSESDGEILYPAGAIDQAVGTGITCLVRRPNQAECEPSDPANPEASGVLSPPDVPLLDITAGTHFACGVRKDDYRPACWGQVKPEVVVSTNGPLPPELNAGDLVLDGDSGSTVTAPSSSTSFSMEATVLAP